MQTNTQINDETVFDLLNEPVHYGSVHLLYYCNLLIQINGMDLCVRKPLIATCSSDCSIRVWNYETHSQECSRFFPEEAFSLSIHPSGLHIIASFSDRIKMLNIGIKNSLHEETTQTKEYSYIKVITEKGNIKWAGMSSR